MCSNLPAPFSCVVAAGSPAVLRRPKGHSLLVSLISSFACYCFGVLNGKADVSLEYIHRSAIVAELMVVIVVHSIHCHDHRLSCTLFTRRVERSDAHKPSSQTNGEEAMIDRLCDILFVYLGHLFLPFLEPSCSLGGLFFSSSVIWDVRFFTGFLGFFVALLPCFFLLPVAFLGGF